MSIKRTPKETLGALGCPERKAQRVSKEEMFKQPPEEGLRVSPGDSSPEGGAAAWAKRTARLWEELQSGVGGGDKAARAGRARACGTQQPRFGLYPKSSGTEAALGHLQTVPD